MSFNERAADIAALGVMNCGADFDAAARKCIAAINDDFDLSYQQEVGLLADVIEIAGSDAELVKRAADIAVASIHGILKQDSVAKEEKHELAATLAIRLRTALNKSGIVREVAGVEHVLWKAAEPLQGTKKYEILVSAKANASPERPWQARNAARKIEQSRLAA